MYGRFFIFGVAGAIAIVGIGVGYLAGKNGAPSENQSALLSNISEVAGEAVSAAKDFIDPSADFKPLAEIDLKTKEVIYQNEESEKTEKSAGPLNCSYKNGDGGPPIGGVIINEVAWMGTQEGYAKEWLELKNNSSTTQDISGWQLKDANEDIAVTFGEKTFIPTAGFFLLERSSDDSVPEVGADFIYTGTLGNENEGLKLFNPKCEIMDLARADSNWPAGENGSKRTMERSSDLSWHTYSGNGSGPLTALILGSPRKENSPAVVYITAGSASSPPPAGGESAPDDVSPPPSNPIAARLLINEIQTSGGPGKTTNDFVEIFNPTNAPVNLKGYRLVKRTKTATTDTSLKSWTGDAMVPARGFHLWANSAYADIGAVPDSTTTGSIADDNGIALRFGSEDAGEIIDSVAWGEASNGFGEGTKVPNLPANQSLQRNSENDSDNNLNDFSIASSTPRNSN